MRLDVSIAPALLPALVLGLGAASVSACGLTLEPSASASLSGDRTTSVRISRTAPRPVAEEAKEDAASVQ